MANGPVGETSLVPLAPMTKHIFLRMKLSCVCTPQSARELLLLSKYQPPCNAAEFTSNGYIDDITWPKVGHFHEIIIGDCLSLLYLSLFLSMYRSVSVSLYFSSIFSQEKKLSHHFCHNRLLFPCVPTVTKCTHDSFASAE